MKKIILLFILLIILAGLYFLVIKRAPEPETVDYVDFPQFEIELPERGPFIGPTGQPQMKGPISPPPVR